MLVYFNILWVGSLNCAPILFYIIGVKVKFTYYIRHNGVWLDQSFDKYGEAAKNKRPFLMIQNCLQQIAHF